MLKIGIDPGVNTGIAVWDSKQKMFLAINTYKHKLHSALYYIDNLRLYTPIEIVCENPNTFIPYNAKASQERRQGAGSVKRDFSFWKDYAEDMGIKFTATRLQGSLKKLSKETFVKYTSWKGKVDEHGIDAAMLVFNS